MLHVRPRGQGSGQPLSSAASFSLKTNFQKETLEALLKLHHYP